MSKRAGRPQRGTQSGQSYSTPPIEITSQSKAGQGTGYPRGSSSGPGNLKVEGKDVPDSSKEVSAQARTGDGDVGLLPADDPQGSSSDTGHQNPGEEEQGPEPEGQSEQPPPTRPSPTRAGHAEPNLLVFDARGWFLRAFVLLAQLARTTLVNCIEVAAWNAPAQGRLWAVYLHPDRVGQTVIETFEFFKAVCPYTGVMHVTPMGSILKVVGGEWKATELARIWMCFLEEGHRVLNLLQVIPSDIMDCIRAVNKIGLKHILSYDDHFGWMVNLARLDAVSRCFRGYPAFCMQQVYSYFEENSSRIVGREHHFYKRLNLNKMGLWPSEDELKEVYKRMKQGLGLLGVEREDERNNRRCPAVYLLQQ